MNRFGPAFELFMVDETPDQQFWAYSHGAVFIFCSHEI